jgi:superfamily II DNA or RNA helicase
LVLPREKVRAVLRNFQDQLLNDNQLALSPVPLKSLFKISATTEMDLEIRPLVEVLQADGEKRFLEREELEKYRYGDLIYVKELGLLAELERPGAPERKFTTPVKMVLKKSQVPEFIQEYGSLLNDETQLVDASVKNLKIFCQADRLEILPEALDRDWCWLSVRYGFGQSSVSLWDILETRREGQRYLAVPEGWVDCRAPEWSELAFLEEKGPEIAGAAPGENLKLSLMELLRLQALHPAARQVATESAPGRRLSQILDLKPARPYQPLKGLQSSLRPYQILGLEWLSFLWENRLGGLLCDDMGLGKTHQVMALLVKLRELEKVRGPFLVVCPTTVLSHWVRKIADHTRGFKTVVYYGGGRELTEALKQKPVLLTTYGILRNDIDSLQEVPFALAVFDEIQNLKNPATQSHQAARQVRAEVKLGLTGTPIENRVGELKALMDLTVPGYLGSDDAFEKRYVKPLETDPRGRAGERLTRLIAPFTLRRLKKTVLLELPEKIEDFRFCELREEQVALYRQAIATQGKELRRALREKKKAIPYLHIFALLTLLKRICDHPAVALKKPELHKNHDSGKWDLFQELLAESLESGQKIVVYSQFLDMLRIMETHLQETGTGFVTLTGASRKRGELIDRFNNDPDCRVFLGSLKAGGTGIDLVAASVVIHYDRWWNAAREDQATDRVHRIGQQRGVQVFKLVTAGTLEEKISAIIGKKKNLLETIVQEDDPNLLKTFTREELLELIS